MTKTFAFVILLFSLLCLHIHSEECQKYTVYLGCHQGGHDFSGAKYKKIIDELTVEKCIEHCSMTENSYVLLQSGNQCYCSDSQPPAKIDECNIKCTGDDTQHCGGVWRSSVYQVKCRQISTASPATSSSTAPTSSTKATTTSTEAQTTITEAPTTSSSTTKITTTPPPPPTTTTTSTSTTTTPTSTTSPTTASPTTVTTKATPTTTKKPTTDSPTTTKSTSSITPSTTNGPPTTSTRTNGTLTSPRNTGKKNQGALIGGAVFGAIVVVAGVVILIIFIIRKKKRDKSLRFTKDSVAKRMWNNYKEDVVVYENLASNLKDTKDLTKVTLEEEMVKKVPNTDPNKPGPSMVPPPDKTEAPDLDTSTEDPDTPVYANAKGGVLKINEIEDYIKKKKTEKPGLEEEYKALLQGQLSPWTVASSQAVKKRNRFKNIYPYDQNRVLIKATPQNSNSDYINASHVNGYNTEKRYIAAQGPKEPCTDFWQMIWEQNVKVIVMATRLFENAKERCAGYWPELDQIKSFGSVQVKNVQETTSSDTTLRRLQVSMNGDTEAIYNNAPENNREVLQFHFTEWPDMNVPDQTTSLINLVRKVRKHTQNSNSPILVHCSAGVGRTGTFIALDYLIDQGEKEGKVDVFGCVNKLREQRIFMVQKKEQYVYLYDCICETLNVGETNVRCDKFTKVLNDPATKSNIVTQYKFLKSYGQSLIKSRRLEAAKLTENENKNRVSANLPSDNARVYLMTLVHGRNDYINAVTAATFHNKAGLFLTQLPLSDTVIDFWRMVYDHKIDTIVMLTDYQDQNFRMAPYWPAEAADKVKSGPFSISKSELTREGNIACCHLVLTYEDKERKIFLVGAVDWEATSWQPTNLNTLYDLYNSVKKWKSENTDSGKTAVQCLDGNMNSGMYAVVSWMFDMIHLEHEVDVYTITKQVMYAKPEFLTKHEQYRALHKIAGDYIESINLYNNME